MFRFKVNSVLAAGLLPLALLVGVVAQRPCPKADERKVVGHLRDARCKSDIDKATIILKGENINRKSKSDSRGNFEFCVTPGRYEVTVEKYGYKRHIVTDLMVTKEANATVDLEMEHGWSSDDPNAGKLGPCRRAS